MGYIDETSYTLTCTKCGDSERKKILDKGSMWSGSHWQSGAEFEKFETTWTGGEREEPTLTHAVCRACGEPVALAGS